MREHVAILFLAIPKVLKPVPRASSCPLLPVPPYSPRSGTSCLNVARSHLEETKGVPRNGGRG